MEYYKENFDDFKEQNKNLLFEQDGASCHTSKKIKIIKENLFGDKFIQNSPHSPDIAYLIETLWTELKRTIKDRNPKYLDEFKIINIEEWNKIQKKFIPKLLKNFIKRCKK